MEAHLGGVNRLQAINPLITSIGQPASLSQQDLIDEFEARFEALVAIADLNEKSI